MSAAAKRLRCRPMGYPTTRGICVGLLSKPKRTPLPCHRVQFRRRARWAGIFALAIAAAVVAWYLASPLLIVTRGTETPPSGFTTTVASGTFVDGEPGHHAAGRVVVLGDGSSYVVRLSEFSVTNGPDIHVFLATAARVAPGDLDLGSVKVTEGSSNYAVPAGVDPRAYAYVVIWCVPFSVQFGYAQLSFP